MFIKVTETTTKTPMLINMDKVYCIICYPDCCKIVYTDDTDLFVSDDFDAITRQLIPKVQVDDSKTGADCSWK